MLGRTIGFGHEQKVASDYERNREELSSFPHRRGFTPLLPRHRRARRILLRQEGLRHARVRDNCLAALRGLNSLKAPARDA